MARPTTPQLLAAAVVLLLYSLPIAGRLAATNPNEVSRIELTAALAWWASPEVTPLLGVYGLSQDRAERGGRVYSDKAPGLSLLAVPVAWIAAPIVPPTPPLGLPAYWPLRHLLTWLLVTLPAVAVPFLVVAAAAPDAVPERRASLALLIALTTPLWTYATVFFSHLPAALMVIGGWLLALAPGRPGRRLESRHALLAGLLLGFSVATEYPTAIVAATVGATLVVRRTAARPLLAFVLGLELGLAPALLYHQAAFGAPWATGYQFKVDPLHAAIHARGLSGVAWPSPTRLARLLFGPSRGLLFYSPLLALAPFGAAICWRARRRDLAPLATASAGYLAFAAGFVDWQAGWSAAARHLTPLVPLLAVMAVPAIVAAQRRGATRLAVAALAGVSASAALLSVALTPFFPEQLSDPLAELVLRSLANGAALPNVVTAVTGLAPVAVVAASAATLFAGLILALTRLAGPAVATRAGVVVALALAIAVHLGLLVATAPAPNAASESVRAAVLRRLGETKVADAVERRLRDPAARAP